MFNCFTRQVFPNLANHQVIRVTCETYKVILGPGVQWAWEVWMGISSFNQEPGDWNIQQSVNNTVKSPNSGQGPRLVYLGRLVLSLRLGM